jgi:ketosteroid isomerase-like protein
MRFHGILAAGLMASVAVLAAACNEPASVSQSGAPQAQVPAAPEDAQAVASQIQEVQTLANRWTEAYNANNPDALGAQYVEDARLYLHGHPTVSTRQRIQEYWAEDMKLDNPLTVLSVTDAVNGIDMKLVHGNYQVINRVTGVPVGHGRFAHIWTRVGDDQWLLDRDVWNAPVEQDSQAAITPTQDVQALADRWTEAYNAKQADALGALYAEDARLYLHGSPTVSTRQRIQEYWAEDMKVENPLTVLTVTNAVSGIDMKLVHGNYQVINRDTGVPVGHGRFAHIWTRSGDDQWLLDRDLWNAPVEE